MAEFPALPLWTDAYLGDTTHLTTIEHGAYLLLLMVAWRSRDTVLPDDDKLLARYTRTNGQQWKRLRPVLAEFFEIENGKWRQKRLSDEAAFVKRVRERQADAGRLSALKRKGRHSTERQETVNTASTPTPTPTPTPIKKKRGANAPPAQGAFELPANVPADAWAGYVEMRLRKRAPMTDRARDGVLLKLQALADSGQPPGDVLDQSTRNSWTDVYELKGRSNERGKSRSGYGSTVDAALDWANGRE